MADYNNAIRYLEKAYELAPKDKIVNILIKSYMACVYGNRPDNAKSIASELKKMNAGQHLNIPSESYTFSNYIPYKTRPQILEAKVLIANGQNEEALTLLEKSIEIYDSHIANRLIGEICLTISDYNKALIYLNKVYPYFKFDPSYLHQLVLVYKAKNDIFTAKKYLDELKQIDAGYEKLNELSLLLS